MTNERRYTVEAYDEYGSYDYDHFESVADALAVAESLVSPGNLVKVVDRQEQATIWDSEIPPSGEPL